VSLKNNEHMILKVVFKAERAIVIAASLFERNELPFVFLPALAIESKPSFACLS